MSDIFGADVNTEKWAQISRVIITTWPYYQCKGDIAQQVYAKFISERGGRVRVCFPCHDNNVYVSPARPTMPLQQNGHSDIVYLLSDYFVCTPCRDTSTTLRKLGTSKM